MRLPIFKPTCFSVSHELRSRTLMGEIRGLEIKERLAALLAGLKPHEAIVVDATDSLIFDYDFSGHAFAPYFDDVRGIPPARRLIFRISGPDRPAFFHGILKRLKKPLRKYAESQEAFAEAGLFCKLTEQASGTIQYVGALSPGDRRILDAIDESGSGSVEDLHASMHLPTEELVDCVRRLVKCGFVLDIGDDEHRYCSFSMFLRSGL